MNSKTTKKTNLITKNNNNNATNNSKKFFLCCSRPPGTPLVDKNMKNHDGSVRPVRRFTDELKEPAFTYVAVREKQGGAFSTMATEAAALSDGGGESDDKEVKDGQKKKKKKKGGDKKFMHIVKAILFETSLAKKLKKRRLQKKLKQASQGKLSTKPEKSLDENSIHQESQDYQHGTIFSTTSSFGSSSIITSSSACSSSLSSNSKSFSDQNKSFRINTIERSVQKQNQDKMQEHGKGYNMQEHKQGCYAPNIASCFLLISLLVLVFWGKICAILCTSFWLFFVPRWTVSTNPSVNMAISSPKALDSHHKKKIIIEGLLERNHSRDR